MNVVPFVAAACWDLALGEPPSCFHPTVWAGRTAAALERMAFRLSPPGQLLFGAAVAGGLPTLAFGLARWATGQRRPLWLRSLMAVWLLKSSFAVRMLLREGGAVAEALQRGDEAMARERLRSLVSRRTEHLDRAHIASAAVESLAENVTDSFVAPWMFAAMAGVPAAIAYRVVNTLDSLWGYHGRYEYLGKTAARLDDALNYVPARLAALLLAAAAGGRGWPALRTAWRERRRTESPNAGWTMATAAGALGVWLEKPGAYRLGGGRAPDVWTVRKAQRLVARAAFFAAVLTAFLSARTVRGWT
ncbi:MAG: adenosylcobinamide-phosphate synthase CbiB [Chloroflexota bacterium]|nr:adenosylcobinamide-phosphate synthase CbiB [Dehalococcoidia bacterium]MDW8047503.1 adenosylcobinamide-phosphate synthase CbiB [Chloroflexota bacterium]